MPPGDSSVEDASINEYVQSRVKVSYSSTLATLRECCNDKKLGSRAKHALKDMALFRLGHPAAGVLLLQLLVLVSHDEKTLGKDERKIGKVTRWFPPPHLQPFDLCWC